ncbi:MAG: diguanylate cyclase [Caldimicrobium sp.]
MLSLLQLPIKNFLKEREILTPSIEITFQDLIELFRKYNTNFAVFLKEKKPVGIITERDVIIALSQRYPLSSPAFHLAKKELFKIKSTDTLFSAFNLMIENNIRRLIVVDENGEFLGVVTQQDLILYSPEEIFKGEGKVRDLVEMKTSLIYATKEEKVEEALSKMVQFNVGAIPILDEELRPIGIITQRDFFTLSPEDLKRPLKELALKKIITVHLRDPLTKAVELFKRYSIRHLIVVDDSGKAVNILSQRDLITSSTSSYTEFLESSLNQFKNFISLIPEIVLELSECDSECRITFMNDFAKKYIGEEYIEKDVHTLFDYDDWNRIYGIIKREKMIYKERIKGRKGEVYEITGSYLDFGLKEGKIKIFLRDVTHEYFKEEKYQKEIRFLKNILDNFLDYLFVIDQKGRIYFANSSFKKALGYSEEEILKKTIFDIVDLPEEEIKRNIELLIKKGVELRGRRYYKDIHQKPIPVEFKAKAVVLNGESFIIIDAREITDILLSEEALKEAYKNLSVFYSFVKDLNFAKSEEELFQTLEKYLLSYVDTFHYFEIDSQTEEIKSTYVSGKREYWEDCLTKEIKECAAYRTGQSFYGLPRYPCKLLNTTSLAHLCIPLFFEGRLQGIVTLIREKPFSEEEIRYLEDKLQVFHLYFNKLRLLRELRDLSFKDPLLGIYNRRFIIEVFKKEELKAQRTGKPFSIILMDLDHFKRINDNYGHPAGDKVLKEVSKLVLFGIRGQDYFGRWGGEEFLILLPETSKNFAIQVAERIRETLEKYEIPISEEISVKITASFGVAEFPSDAPSWEGLLRKVDERLYKAKALGRNMVISE